LYALADRCGGNFTYTKDGIKDCTNCLLPHRRENYPKICSKVCEVIEMTKKPQDKP
jgi:Zn-finger protein